jgi:imidazolonepropionase-like amidohydrolase
VAAGVDTVEHCTWANGDGSDQPVDTAWKMAQQGIHACAAISADWRNYAARYGDEIAERFIRRVRWLDEQGVRLIAGTDAGIADAPFDDFPGSLELSSTWNSPECAFLPLPRRTPRAHSA